MSKDKYVMKKAARKLSFPRIKSPKRKRGEKPNVKRIADQTAWYSKSGVGQELQRNLRGEEVEPLETRQ